MFESLERVAAALDGSHDRGAARVHLDVSAERAHRDFLVGVRVLVEAGAAHALGVSTRPRPSAPALDAEHFVAGLLALVAAADVEALDTDAGDSESAPQTSVELGTAMSSSPFRFVPIVVVETSTSGESPVTVTLSVIVTHLHLRVERKGLTQDDAMLSRSTFLKPVGSRVSCRTLRAGREHVRPSAWITVVWTPIERRDWPSRSRREGPGPGHPSPNPAGRP